MSNTPTSEMPLPQPSATLPNHIRQPRWVAPTLVGALAVGLAGLGVGAYALATMPAKTTGPRGPVGPRGAIGPQGDPGPKGDVGTIADTSIVAASPLTSSANPAVGTVLVARTSCPFGLVLMSGGADVSAPGVQADRNVELRSSFPVNKSHWQTVAIVTGPLGAGVSMTMKPFVVCGLPATTTSTSATTTTAPSA